MTVTGLQKQVVSLRVGGGLAQGEDAFLQDQPRELILQNAHMDERGAIAKRSSATPVSPSGLPVVATHGRSNALFDHQGALLQLSPNGLYRLDSGPTNAWTIPNPACPRPSRVLTDPLIRGNLSLRNADVAINSGVMCVVWEDTLNSKIKYAFFNAETLSMVAGPKDAPSQMETCPKLIVMGSFFVLVAGAAGNIYASSSHFSAYSFASATSLGAAGNTDFDVAAKPNGVRFTLVYRDTLTTGTAKEYSLGFGNTATLSLGTFKPCAVMYNPVLSTVVVLDLDGKIARFADDYSGLVTTSSPWTPTANITMCRGTICQLDATGKMFVALSDKGFLKLPTTTTTELGTDIVELSTTYTAVRMGALPTVAIAAKAYYLGDSDNNVPGVVLPVADQATEDNLIPAMPVGYLVRPVVDAAGNYTAAVCGRFLQDKIDESTSGSVLTREHHLSHSINGFEGECWFAATVLTDIFTSAGANTTRRQIDLVRAKVIDAPALRNVTAQSLRFVGGGAGLDCYDGSRYAENTPSYCHSASTSSGALEFDTTISIDWSIASPSAPSGGGDHLFKFVWRWTDAQGNLHRGEPSSPIQLTNTALHSNVGANGNPKQILLAVPLTAINGDLGLSLEVEVHQGATSGPLLSDYRIIGIVKPRALAGYPTFVGVTLAWAQVSLPEHAVNVLPGATAVANPQLYTVLELASSTPPPFLDVVSTQSRLWGLSAENRFDLLQTKPIVPGIAPEWNSVLRTAIPHEGGDTVGLAALADKVVIFKERQIYVVTGAGPNAAGLGGALSQPRLIPSDVGCVNRVSIVEGPFGVLFQSEKGICMLSPGLEVTFIGENAKTSIGDLTIMGATIVPEHSEVRFVTQNDALNMDQVVIWNYRLNIWHTWTAGVNAIASCLWRGNWTLLGEDNLVDEYAGQYDPTTADGLLQIATSWIKLAQLQGFKRVWRITFLGRWYSGGLQISAFYNYDSGDGDGNAESWEWTDTELDALKVGGNRIQISVRPSIQKIESLALFIQEQEAEGNDPGGQGFELVGIDLECGVGKGSYKRLPPGARR